MLRRIFLPIKHPRKLLVIFLASISLTWGIGQMENPQIDGWGLQAVNAQTLRPEQAAAVIYEQLPYLSKENQYISVETGEIDPTHTLINRFIRYHQDIKRRSPLSSLDWKVTLADYLGINQSIRESSYPGESTLKTHPLKSDLKAINQLNRRQRQELVDLLVKLYKPESETTKKPEVENSPETSKTPETSTPSTPSTPNLSEPGDANLLMP